MFRSHSNCAQLLIETSRIVAMPLKMAAYLMGHLDGANEQLDLARRCPAIRDSGLEEHFDSLQHELRAAWNTRKSWDGLAGVDGIVSVIVAALATAGVELSLSQDPPGSTVHAPFTVETMPNGEADMEIIRMRRILGLA